MGLDEVNAENELIIESQGPPPGAPGPIAVSSPTQLAHKMYREAVASPTPGMSSRRASDAAWSINGGIKQI